MDRLLDFAFFTFISSLEYIAIFSLMFAIFRHPMRGLGFHIAFACLLLSYVSYTMRTAGVAIEAFAPLVQMILISMLVWLLFRNQWFYAVCMGLAAIFLYVFIQAIVAFLSIESGFISKMQLVEHHWKASVVPVSTVLITILITLALRRWRLGFTFIPYLTYTNQKFRGYNNSIVLVCFLSVVTITSIGMYLWFTVEQSSSALFWSMLIKPLVLVWLLRQALRREVAS